MDSLRQSAAFDIQRAHRLQVRGEGGRWRAYTERGQAVTALDHDDPVTALEAAQTALTDAQDREQERRVKKLFQALNAAKYMPWPRVRQSDGMTEWLILQVSDRQPVGQSKDGLISALIEIAKLVNGA